MSAASSGTVTVTSGSPAAFHRTITWRPSVTSVVSRARTLTSVSSAGCWR